METAQAKPRETLESELAHARDTIAGLKRKLAWRSPLDERERAELIDLRAEVDRLVAANRRLQSEILGRYLKGVLADVAKTLADLVGHGRRCHNDYVSHMAQSARDRLAELGACTKED